MNGLPYMLANNDIGGAGAGAMNNLGMGINPFSYMTAKSGLTNSAFGGASPYLGNSFQNNFGQTGSPFGRQFRRQGRYNYGMWISSQRLYVFSS